MRHRELQILIETDIFFVGLDIEKNISKMVEAIDYLS
jgi:hypothetical protein